MILSNVEIFNALKEGFIKITPQPIYSIGEKGNPYDTTALNLRLSETLLFPKADRSYAFDLRRGKIANTLRDMYEPHKISREGGFSFAPGQFALANTKEVVELPINKGKPCYAARIEGRSSFARCGLLIHFTAPTIHAGFNGTITLELMNLGSYPIMFYPDMEICQLIFEKVEGDISQNPSQFQAQTTPEGLKA
jgi:dCTP deaminase